MPQQLTTWLFVSTLRPKINNISFPRITFRQTWTDLFVSYVCLKLSVLLQHVCIHVFLLVYSDLEKGGVCLRVCLCVFHDLKLLRYVLRCAIERQL